MLETKDYELWHGDCLQLMKKIADKSVDCIITDLPYKQTHNDWDEIIPFKPLWKQYKRIIKDNGAIILFGNGMFTAKLMTSNPARSALHPTQKPLALIEELIKTYTNEGDLVVDSCMGSNTTGLGCLNLNRRFIGIEKDDEIFKVAKQRICQ